MRLISQKRPTLLNICIVLSVCHNVAFGIEPVSVAAGITAAGFSLFVASFTAFKCNLYECCTPNWIKLNSTSLKADLTEHVHGQHLVAPAVLKALKGHHGKAPEKALVLSFHGGTGSGKNFVSRIIVDNMYIAGMRSKHVHLFLATHHFPHKSRIETYKDQLRDWIKGNVTLCERSIFIFDEMDKLHPGLIDVIKPYIDYYQEINGVDYRKTVFIFLSNTGSSGINDLTMNYHINGLKREDITYKEMENVLKLEAYNENSGLWHSSLIEKDLINVFVPFLPMQRIHVKQCIRDDMRQKGHKIDELLVSKVADELQYFPTSSQIFSKTGCKRVSDKVNLVLLNA